MRNFLSTAALVFFDLAATVLFLVVLRLGGSLSVAVGAGMGLGIVQIGWEIARRRPVETLQWVGLILVLVSGALTLLTGDARVVMLKPTIIYVLIGIVMLRRGWMMRYLSPVVRETVPDVAMVFGYIWAALMFVTAVLNIGMALSLGALAWASFMSLWAICSKVGLFLVQYLTMFIIIRRRLMTQSGEAGTTAA